MKKFRLIAVDADDTLWDNQSYYDRAEEIFCEQLAGYGSAEQLSDILFKTESANMPILGYGAKAVCISMMETALEISGDRPDGARLRTILQGAKSLLQIPVKPLPGVSATLEKLREGYGARLVLLTKGDMLDQENKLERSGLGKYFDRVETVSTKGEKEYRELCGSENVSPEDFLMIGNSFKSDIQPVLAIGGYGFHIPFHTIWKHELVQEFSHPNLSVLSSFSEVIPELERLSNE